jgi:hypothetical protein
LITERANMTHHQRSNPNPNASGPNPNRRAALTLASLTLKIKGDQFSKLTLTC